MPPFAAPPGGSSEQPPIDRGQRRPATCWADLAYVPMTPGLSNVVDAGGFDRRAELNRLLEPSPKGPGTSDAGIVASR